MCSAPAEEDCLSRQAPSCSTPTLERSALGCTVQTVHVQPEDVPALCNAKPDDEIQ